MLRDNLTKVRSCAKKALVPNGAPRAKMWLANYTAAGNFQKVVPRYRDLVFLGSQANALEKR